MNVEKDDIQPSREIHFADVAKDFSAWHGLKQVVHDSIGPRPFYHEREIWWCRTGLNIGFESDGKGVEYVRPVLILKGISLQIYIGVPITTKNKVAQHRVPIDLNDGISRCAVISQIRSFDSKRLWKKMAMLGKEDFEKTKQAVIDMFQ